MNSDNNCNRDHGRYQSLSEGLQITLEFFVCFLKMFLAILEAVLRLVLPRTEKTVKGEIVLITGAGHGMGRELALLYAAQNAIVVCWDLDDQSNKDTVTKIETLGEKAFAYTCDVSNRDQVIETVAKVQKEVGEITIVINNAGVLISRPFLEHSKEEIERTMNINVISHFWILQAVLPTMIKNNRGHIVALSSGLGLAGNNNVVPYSTSKFAVRGMMTCLGEELRQNSRTQIKLTTAYPYIVDTGLCKSYFVRFPSVFPVISARKAAQAIMSAQRKDIVEMCIPAYGLNFIFFLKTLPYKVEHLLSDLLCIKFGSDPK